MLVDVLRWSGSKVVFLVAVGFCVVCIGEIFFRLPVVRQRLEYEPDPVLHGQFVPSQRGYMWLANQSLMSPEISINGEGLRGREPVCDQRVIIALGSSQAFGSGVRDDEVWTSILESRLVAKGHDYQVVNAAHPGYGAWHNSVVLRRFFRRRTADVVIYRVSIGDRQFRMRSPERQAEDYRAALRRKDIRQVTRFLPYLYAKMSAQFSAIKKTIADLQLRESKGVEQKRNQQIGEGMAQRDRLFWKEMIELTLEEDARIVFLLHNPYGDEELCSLCLSAHLFETGHSLFGLDHVPRNQQRSRFRTQFTLVRDPHANAAQHRVIGNAVAGFLDANLLLRPATASQK